MIDIWSAFGRSIRLGLVVMVLTVIFSLMAGLAFRKTFMLSGALFHHLQPDRAVDCHRLGVALEFRILDDMIKAFGDSHQVTWIIEDFRTTMGCSVPALARS